MNRHQSRKSITADSEDDTTYEVRVKADNAERAKRLVVIRLGEDQQRQP